MKCAKCKADFALITTIGNTKTYRCNCPRQIVETTQADPIEARIKALEIKTGI
jgi:DNA-directed RNA polymerase subunit RPC12/RpoP